MTSLNRVELYLSFGYSAERASELLGWPLREVRELKSKGPAVATKQFFPHPKISDAVHMVLRGATPQVAAKKIGTSVFEVLDAVEKARLEIDRMAKASG